MSDKRTIDDDYYFGPLYDIVYTGEDIVKIDKEDVYVGVDTDSRWRTVQEPYYSETKIKEIKDKYNISDEDFEKLIYNLRIFIKAGGNLSEIF